MFGFDIYFIFNFTSKLSDSRIQENEAETRMIVTVPVKIREILSSRKQPVYPGRSYYFYLFKSTSCASGDFHPNPADSHLNKFSEFLSRPSAIRTKKMKPLYRVYRVYYRRKVSVWDLASQPLPATGVLRPGPLAFSWPIVILPSPNTSLLAPDSTSREQWIS